MREEKLEIAIEDKKDRPPRLPFLLMKKAVLGARYELSIAVVTQNTSRKLNKKFRKKNNPTNILSFSLSKTSGEIILCPDVIKKEAPKFGMPYAKFFGFLVIHGMLHLKGMEHSSTMDSKEELFKKKFDLMNTLKK